MEWHARDPLGDQRKHDVAAVAVAEALTRGELHLVPSQGYKVLLGRGQFVDRHWHQVVVPVGLGLLVEVVADARAVREQLLDGHLVVDQRQIRAKHRTRTRREGERPVLNQGHDCQCGQPFRAARDRKARLHGIRDHVAAVR